MKKKKNCRWGSMELRSFVPLVLLRLVPRSQHGGHISSAHKLASSHAVAAVALVPVRDI